VLKSQAFLLSEPFPARQAGAVLEFLAFLVSQF
jgi:hypothetical protein